MNDSDISSQNVSSKHLGQWRLDQIELVNWGTFHGHHRVEIARKGYLLTGHSGSGKTSLVDAITAVLTPRGRTRFNAAAADGTTRADDRTVLSYVRGAWRRAADDETGEIATQYLRAGATWSGIALRFGNGLRANDGGEQKITLVKLFHVKRGVNTPAEVQDLHIVSHGDLPLLELEPYAQNGLDMRAIKRQWPNLDVRSDHSQFAARFCRALGITGEQAILLLHKTQSAKNLGSLDELFRTFMLDEPATFKTADRAIEQFSELSGAHEAVVQSRLQIEHLTPLEVAARLYDEAGARADNASMLVNYLDDFTKAWKLALAREDYEHVQNTLASAEHEAKLAYDATQQAEQHIRDAEALVGQRGGWQLEVREAELREAQVHLQAAQERHNDLQRDLEAVEIPMPKTVAEFTQLRTDAAKTIESSPAEQAEKLHYEQIMHDKVAILTQKRDIESELQALRGAKSNVGRALSEARQRIAEATGLPVAAVPFAAELIQIKSDYVDWTGAIERVLRPIATVLLVPAAHESKVSAAADALHLGAHLRFEVVPHEVAPPPKPEHADSLLYRIEVAEHRMAPWLHSELARRFDYRCVPEPAQLTQIERGVTKAGQVKRGRRSYEKDDRFAVTDRSRWVLGFDNAAKVDYYLEELRETSAKLELIDKHLGKLERARQNTQRRLLVLAKLVDLQWQAIDVAAQQLKIANAKQARAELLTKNIGLRELRQRLEDAKAQAASAREVENAKRTTAAAAGAELAALTAELEQMTADQIAAIPDDVAQVLREEFQAVKSTRQVTYRSIEENARKVMQVLHQRSNEANAQRSAAGQEIISLAERFITKWPSLAADLTADIADRSGFLQLLANLRADRLPDFEKRFFDMLREQSQQNIGVLANQIRGAIHDIKRRVQPINESLLRSQFSPGCFLQIKVDPAQPTVVKEFLADLNTIASGSLALDESQANAEARFAVLARVMRQLSSSEAADRNLRQLFLDTRRHVKFIGREVDSTGVVMDVYDSGAGRSGGQKQKLVVFCLAAALRYQLTDEGQDFPTYGTVVMDEAFDKADAAFTRMALEIFREFGFHMLLATPLKLLTTLEDFVGGIALVTCRDSRDSRIDPVPFDEIATDLEEITEPVMGFEPKVEVPQAFEFEFGAAM